jgi:hypothetical protein
MTKEEFEFNKKQQYIVTEEDIMEATANIMSAKEGPIAELLSTTPSLTLLVPIITIDLWKNIVEKKQSEAQDQVTNIMASILGSNIDKEDK